MMMMGAFHWMVLAFASIAILIPVEAGSSTGLPIVHIAARPSSSFRKQQYISNVESSCYSTSVHHDSLHRIPGNRRSARSNKRDDSNQVQLCAASGRSIPATLLRGAALRIASDMCGGTPFESIKCQVTATRETAGQAVRRIVREGGIRALWTGAPSRTVEGACVGAVFMLASTATRTQLAALGAGPTVAALTAGMVGGMAQATIMTPAGMVFTSLNVNRGKPGHEHDNAWSTARRIVHDQGPFGLYYGFKPMCLRQATNWASRAGLTEVARSVLGLQRFGILGEIGSGILGGLGSCWNTPIETIRVNTQRDLSTGVPVKDIPGYWTEIVERDGYPGLFRGVTPRAFQAIWQTCFMVVVPTIMGI